MATGSRDHGAGPKRQSMKPATVAKKLGIYLPATPQEFQDSTITRADFAEDVTTLRSTCRHNPVRLIPQHTRRKSFYIEAY